MWIRTYRGDLCNANTLSAIRFTKANEIRRVVYGVGKDGKQVDLLAYLSWSNLGFEKLAIDAITEGMRRRSEIVDLSGICKRYDYTE